MPPMSIARLIERERKKPITQVFAEAEARRLTLPELCDDLGVSRETTRKHLDDAGFEVVETIRSKCPAGA